MWVRVPRIVDINVGLRWADKVKDLENLEKALRERRFLPNDIHSSLHGQNLLTYSIDNWDFWRIPLLLRMGADPTLVDLQGRSAVDWAREYAMRPTTSTDIRSNQQVCKSVYEFAEIEDSGTTSMIHDAILGKITVPLEECIALEPWHINTLDSYGNAPLY